MTRPRKKNPVLAALLKDAIARERTTIDDLGAATGLGRQAVGRIVRGEVQRLAPEQANELVKHLPLSMASILAACGYHIAVTPPQKLPPEFVSLWPTLPAEVQQGLLALARGATKTSDGEAGGGP